MRFVVLAGLLLVAALANADGFIGAAQCRQCHAEEYAQWAQSHHARAMQRPGPETVLGDFSGVSLDFGGITTRFYREAGEHRIETMGPDGEPQDYAIAYTFGFKPLQQYLVDIGDGHLQALNVAWDARPPSEGGQRWFHLQPGEDMSPANPFFWTRHYQNWNSRCADCHSTGVERNYSPASHRFETTYRDINVACEACHGPGARHVELVGSGRYSADETGFDHQLEPRLSWSFDEGAAIAKPDVAEPAAGANGAAWPDTCGACHSRRLQLATGTAGAFHDRYLLQLIEPPFYFEDGQIRDEVFVTGSFLQSRMHQAGVTCGDCHEPHSGELRAEGNALCAQCHQPSVFDRESHHGFSPASSAQCVDCHMPARTYMQVDDRRDHSFVVPGRRKPDLDDDNLPAIWRGSLLARLDALSDANLAKIRAGLASTAPLVRRGAVVAAGRYPLETRWPLLAPLLDENLLAVRFELGRALSELPASLRQAEPRLDQLLADYRAMLETTSDSPASQTALAMLAAAQGDPALASAAFEQALRIDPDHVPALLNAGDFARASGNEARAFDLLKRAVDVAPESAAANHSFGLALVRRRQYDTALSFLERAATAADATPRFAFVYAVALDGQGKTGRAIEVLENASAQWPGQQDIEQLLVRYRSKSP